MKSEEQKVQEGEYIFPYHYSSILIPHLSIPYNIIINKIIEEVKLYDIKMIADLGCGDGFLIYNLRKEINKTIHGYDYSRNAIAFARSFNHNIDFFIHDITTKPLLYKYDIVILQDIIEHIEPNKLNTLICNLHKSVNEDAIIILTTPTENIKVSKKHFQHFNIDKIKQYFYNYEVIHFCYLWSKNLYLKFIFFFLLWLCFVFCEFRKTKLKKIYFSLLNLTKQFFKRAMFKSNKKNGSNIFVVLRKITEKK